MAATTPARRWRSRISARRCGCWSPRWKHWGEAAMSGARDLIGYGGKPPPVAWPNGAAGAVSLVVNYEEGAELSVEDGDPSNERVGEIISVVDPGRPDLGQGQIFAYRSEE